MRLYLAVDSDPSKKMYIFFTVIDYMSLLKLLFRCTSCLACLVYKQQMALCTQYLYIPQKSSTAYCILSNYLLNCSSTCMLLPVWVPLSVKMCFDAMESNFTSHMFAIISADKCERLTTQNSVKNCSYNVTAVLWHILPIGQFMN